MNSVGSRSEGVWGIVLTSVVTGLWAVLFSAGVARADTNLSLTAPIHIRASTLKMLVNTDRHARHTLRGIGQRWREINADWSKAGKVRSSQAYFRVLQQLYEHLARQLSAMDDYETKLATLRGAARTALLTARRTARSSAPNVDALGTSFNRYARSLGSFAQHHFPAANLRAAVSMLKMKRLTQALIAFRRVDAARVGRGLHDRDDLVTLVATIEERLGYAMVMRQYLTEEIRVLRDRVREHVAHELLSPTAVMGAHGAGNISIKPILDAAKRFREGARSAPAGGEGRENPFSHVGQ